jgi:polyisoprenoid-binding protein YceI
MKATKLLLATVWVLALQFNNQVLAQTFGVKTYKLTINGTSSLHEWESKVEKLDAKGSFAVTDNALTDIKDVVVKIPVTSIKSTKGKMMDNKTYDAFNHEKNPNIIFTLTNRKVNEANQTLDVSGNLTMAGVTKAIDLSVKYKILPGGELQVSGSKKLNMLDYKMDPPTAMMGAIHVGDEVTVNFELVLSQTNIVKTSK